MFLSNLRKTLIVYAEASGFCTSNTLKLPHVHNLLCHLLIHWEQ